MTKKDMNKLQQEVRELFDELWQVPRFAGARRVLRPQVDCYHTDEPHQLVVVVELPGVDPQDVSILATERELLIAGERKRHAHPLADHRAAADRRRHHRRNLPVHVAGAAGGKRIGRAQ